MVSRAPQSTPLIFVGVAILSFVACFGISALITSEDEGESASLNTESTPTEDAVEKPDFVDLQSTLDEWVSSTSGTKGVVIYDLDSERVAAEYRPDADFNTASLYKLFPVYLGYTKVENGELDSSAKAASGYTVGKCLDLAIRESNSTCAESLIQLLGPRQVQKAAEAWGAKNTNVKGLQSTPEDIIKVLQKYYQHSELSDETYTKILDSMLEQPPINNGLCDGPCDWRQGLPNGCSNQSKVYNKVGWEHGDGNYWNLYHDAAIVETPSNLENTPHHYAIVVMTSKINPTKIAALGEKIEKKVLDSAHN